MNTARFSPSRLQAIIGVLLGLARFSLPASGQAYVESVYAGTYPDSAPKYWLETITHADQSSSRLLAFQTIPGVNYRVESSKDLTNWTEIGFHTGGGQQVLVPMVQMKAPPTPVPPPENPPPPVIPHWMMMQKATAGGIVLYWHSMSRGQDERIHLSFQSHHFPNLTLDPAWEEYFIYVRKFDSFAYSITHPRSLSIAPPDTQHSTEDLAMLTNFEANFGTMDAEVRDHIAAVRYIPPPAPPADNSGREFFRIWADWSADSDGDTVPDWEEFAMMAGVAGVGEDGKFTITGTPDTLGAPFNADANNNGTPDGEELDFDKDLLPRSEDADPNDGVIAWRKTRPTRYALFDVPLATYQNGFPKWPVAVNSQGMVLFPNGVYYGDDLRTLKAPAGVYFEQAFAINDKGEILGGAEFNRDGGRVYGTTIWTTPTADPFLVTDSDSVLAYPTQNMAYGGLSFSSAFGNDGSFVATAFEPIAGTNPTQYEDLGRKVWTLDTDGNCSYPEGSTSSSYCVEAAIHWGWNDAGQQILTAPDGGGDLGKTGFDKYNLVDGREAVMSGGLDPSIFRVKNAWKKSSTLGNVLDISNTGIARVNNAPSSEKIPEGLGFWMNSKFLHLDTIVPDLPDDYTGSKLKVCGMANMGQIVIMNDPGPPYIDPAKCAVGFPCAIEDDTADAVRLAYRDSDTDTVPFTGVDDVSITADKRDAAADNMIWIMAPIGSEATGNDMKARIPASVDNPLTLEADNMDGEKTVTVDGQEISLKGTGAATSDKDLTLKLASNTALNAPIGVKAMKRRTVRVTVTPVAGVYKKAYPSGTNETAPNGPDYLPEKERLQKYLNKTFELQLNAEIDLTIKPLVTLDFSTMGEESFIPNNLSEPPTLHDRYLETNPDMNTVEQLAFLSLRDPNADINVYVFGGLSIRHWYYHPVAKRFDYLLAAGLASITNREAWVDGDFFGLEDFGYEPGDGKYKHVMYTIAHEMGHIIIKAGHPDQGEGAAPLPGTDHLERLMVAGGGPARGKKLGTRIVKGEWDAAEEWLKKCPYPPIQSSSQNP